jgi:hypothetical protein
MIFQGKQIFEGNFVESGINNHAYKPKDKHTLLTPSHGLFLTCRGEKYTVLIQYCTVYNVRK